MWKASRCAVRWPIPGSRESSATRRASGAGPSALTSPGGRRAAHAPVIPPIFELASSWAARSALVDRGLDHLGEHLGLLGVDRLGVDR